MSEETLALQELALGFGTKWYETNDEEERAQLFRSYMLSLMFIANEQVAEGDATVYESEVALLGIRRDDKRRYLERVVYGSVETVGRHVEYPDTPLELLQSLAANEGKYRHNLKRPVRRPEQQ